MALPPQPFGNMVDRQPQDIPQDGLGVEVPVAAPPDFSSGAQVTMQDDGSALIEALSAMEGADEQELQAALSINDTFMGAAEAKRILGEL